MSFALRNPNDIPVEEAFDRVKVLSLKERTRFDKERYLPDALGRPLGSKMALIWIDIVDDFTECYDKEDEVQIDIFTRLMGRFRDETTRKLAVEIIRQSKEKSDGSS